METDLTTVVIVNYNGSRYLRECLSALRSQTLPPHRFEVVVVDNASADGSVELLRREFPWVRVLALAENRGFAGGNNAGFAVAHGSRVALLNNDTAADPHWLAELCAALDAHPEAGGAASKLVFHAEPGKLNSAGLDLLPDGRGRDRGFRAADAGQYESGREVFAGCGAALLLRRELIDELGGFDERFFMYYEDLDLAWRARLRGWGFVYVPGSVVRHIHCGSSGEWSPFFCFHVERNRVLTALRNGDPFLALWSVVGLCARVVRAGLRALKGRGPDGRNRGRFGAYGRALASLAWRLPGALAERWRGRRTSPPRPPSPKRGGGCSRFLRPGVRTSSSPETINLEHPPPRFGEGGRGGEVLRPCA